MEPSLYSLIKKNIFVNHISSRGWLLTVNTVTSNRYMGLVVANDVGHRHTVLKAQYGAVWTGGYGPYTGGRPMATVVEI